MPRLGGGGGREGRKGGIRDRGGGSSMCESEVK